MASARPGEAYQQQAEQKKGRIVFSNLLVLLKVKHGYQMRRRSGGHLGRQASDQPLQQKLHSPSL